jgi:acetylornithine deacetylase
LPAIEDGKLYGLGSNDAGGCLVSLLATFCNFYERKDLKYNLLFAASAEEEISGINGIEALLPKLGKIDCAIVGEPTQMQMAVAERGLMVLDCIANGKAGHAARNEGENAIYKALKDIEWFKNLSVFKSFIFTGSCKDECYRY